VTISGAAFRAASGVHVFELLIARVPNTVPNDIQIVNAPMRQCERTLRRSFHACRYNTPILSNRWAGFSVELRVSVPPVDTAFFASSSVN